MINPRQIEAFRAVMLTGGITAAAELLNISQPAVSRLIRDLQQMLGLSLFERRGTGLLPTSEGLSLYQEVERSFVGLDRIEHAAKDLKLRRAGVLRLAAMPAFANGFLPRVVGRFMQSRPKLSVSISSLTSSSVLESVATGQCDLGFVQAPTEHAVVVTERLPAVDAVAVVPGDHPLAGKPVLRPEDFAGEVFVSLGQSTLLRFRIDALFADHEVERQMRVETPVTMVACSLVATGVGLSIVDPFTAEQYARSGVAVRPFEPRIAIEFAVLWSAQRALSGVVSEFKEAFRSDVAKFAERGRC